MTRMSKLLALLSISTMTAACGGGSGTAGSDGGGTPGTTSGVAGTKTLANLTAADKKAICDWTASLYGGYGKTIECGNVGGFDLTIYAPADLAECLAKAATVPSTCQVTVAQSETCVKAMADCDENNDLTVCAAMFTCVPPSP